jgi:hypothetical protein
MIAEGDETAIALARLRRAGWLPSDMFPLAQAEARAAEAGRQIVIVSGEDEAMSLAVLAWQGTEPAASPHPPRLGRRALSRHVTKTLVIVYALLADPQTSRGIVTEEQVLAVINMLTSRKGEGWAIPALRQELPRAGLITPSQDGWAPGPVMRAWDLPTRDVMAHAARQLWEHPTWPGTRGD